jgi:hypothetical protein
MLVLKLPCVVDVAVVQNGCARQRTDGEGEGEGEGENGNDGLVGDGDGDCQQRV